MMLVFELMNFHIDSTTSSIYQPIVPQNYLLPALFTITTRY